MRPLMKMDGVELTPELIADAHLRLHALGVLRRIEARIELRGVESRLGRIFLEEIRLERLLVGEQPVVIFPELPLLTRALARFSGLERLRVNRGQRESPSRQSARGRRRSHAASSASA